MNECEFSNLLFLWQAFPELLTDEQWEALESHLTQTPACSLCYSSMWRNENVILVLGELANA